MNAPVVDTSTVVNFVVSLALPLFLAYLQSWKATSQFKAAFSFCACLVASLVVTVLTKAFVGHWSDDMAENIRLVTLNIVVMCMTAWNMYARLYKPTQVTDKLEENGPQLGKPTAGTKAPRHREGVP